MGFNSGFKGLNIKYIWNINVALFHSTQPCPFGRNEVLSVETLYKTQLGVTGNGGYSGKIWGGKKKHKIRQTTFS